MAGERSGEGGLTMYIYEGHLGGLFASEYSIPFDRLYCETCGDSDRELGNVETVEELIALLADDIAWPAGRGGWALEHIMELIDHVFPDSLITYAMVKKLIRKARRADHEAVHMG